MTVQELIKRLQELSPDAPALARNVDGELMKVDDADEVMIDGVMSVYITGNY
jgi:hypothetical protein